MQETKVAKRAFEPEFKWVAKFDYYSEVCVQTNLHFVVSIRHDAKKRSCVHFRSQVSNRRVRLYLFFGSHMVLAVQSMMTDDQYIGLPFEWVQQPMTCLYDMEDIHPKNTFTIRRESYDMHTLHPSIKPGSLRNADATPPQRAIGYTMVSCQYERLDLHACVKPWISTLKHIMTSDCGVILPLAQVILEYYTNYDAKSDTVDSTVGYFRDRIPWWEYTVPAACIPRVTMHKYYFLLSYFPQTTLQEELTVWINEKQNVEIQSHRSERMICILNWRFRSPACTCILSANEHREVPQWDPFYCLAPQGDGYTEPDSIDIRIVHDPEVLRDILF